MAAPPRPAIRRPVSITITGLSFVVVLVASPVIVPVLLLVDLITVSHARRARVWSLVLGVLAMELLGVAAAAVITVVHIGRLDGAVAQERFHRLERWWAARHLANFRRFAGLEWVIENPEGLDRGNAIVLARHASHADALLPVLLFAHQGGRKLLYTLKDDLQWTPAIDIVGNRVPNVFVNRSPDTDPATPDRIEELAGHLDDDHVAIIFPEGTFYTPERLDRAARRIATTRPDLETSVRSLRHLLPPRPAGTMSLLRGAPSADLVLVAHEGMEAFGDLADIVAGLPLREPVKVRLWYIDRTDVPDDEDELITWLLERWIEMDQWIQEMRDART